MSKAIITEQHLHDIADAIIAKGGATAPMTPAQMPAAIQSIPSGGEDPLYIPPSDWPDIREIIKNDVPPDGVVSSDNIITLFYGTDTPTFSINNHTVKWDDGTITTGVNSRQLTGRGFHWAISYGVTDSGGIKTFSFTNNKSVVWIYGVGNSSLTGASTSTLTGCTVLRFVDIPKINLFSNQLLHGDYSLEYVGSLAANGGEQLNQFKHNYSLRTVAYANETPIGIVTVNSANPLERIIAPSGVKSVKGLVCFRNAASLSEIPKIDFSPATDVASAFYGCVSLREICDTLDLSGITESNSISIGHGLYNTFRMMYDLRRVPVHITSAFSFGFPDSYAIEVDSIATFDSQGNVNGGLAYHINSIIMAASVVSVSDLPTVGDRFTIYDVDGVKYRWRYNTQTYTVATSGYEDTATITFHADIKNKFTNEERIAVEAAFNAKGWTLAW